MLQYNPSISGSLSVTGSLIVTNGVIGTVNGVDIQIFSSSINQVVTNIQTATGSQDGRLTSIESFTSSVSTTNTFTASASERLNSIETVSASNIGRLNSIETITASNIARLTSLEITTGSLATTGSNTFIGTQTITGSLFISSNLIVQGTSSLQNITASAVSIGTNIVNLNTANPAIRYAGLVIGDSGSVGGSGSFLYDSVQDEMLFIHRGDSSVVTSSVALMGPETYDNVGNEIYLTTNRLPKGTGKEHLIDSCIFDNGTTVCINANLVGSGTICGTSATLSGPLNLNYVSPVLRLTDSSATGNAGDVTIRAEKTGVGYNNLTTVALSYNLKGGGSETSFLNIGSSGIACFNNMVCTPLLSVNAAVRLYGSSSGIGCSYIVTATGTNEQPAIILEKAGGFGQSEIRTYYNDVPNYGLAFRAGSTTGVYINSSGYLGVGTSSPLTSFTVKSTNDNGYALTRPADGTVYHWRLSTTETGGDAYTVRYNTFNNNMLFTSYQAGGTGGNIIFRTSNSGGSGSETERFRINCNGVGIFSCEICSKQFRGNSFSVSPSGVFRGGLYTCNQISGTGTDCSLTLFSEGGANGGNFYITTGGSADVKFAMDCSGISCFRCTISVANLSTQGFIRANGAMKTFVAQKNFAERLSNVDFFRVSSSVNNGYQVVVYSFSQNSGVGWSQSQIFQAVTAPYWGGWVGTSTNVSTIGSGSPMISSAVVGNDGTITFRVTTGNNGTVTDGTIQSYIQITAFNIDNISVTVL